MKHAGETILWVRIRVYRDRKLKAGSGSEPRGYGSVSVSGSGIEP
jgi:hypothetical protein